MKNVEALTYKVMLKCHVRAKMLKKNLKKIKTLMAICTYTLYLLASLSGIRDLDLPVEPVNRFWKRLQGEASRRVPVESCPWVWRAGCRIRVAENDGWSSGNEATGAVSDNRYLWTVLSASPTFCISVVRCLIFLPSWLLLTLEASGMFYASDCAGFILAWPYCYFSGCFGPKQAEVEVASKNKNLVEQKSDGCGWRAGLHKA